MHHFFVSQEQISEKEIKILGQDVRHIRQVLRMEEGEELLVGDGEAKRVSLSDPKDRGKSCDRLDPGTKNSQTELPSEITLYQGLPKGDKMELIVQKTVELGRKPDRSGRNETLCCKAGSEESRKTRENGGH